MATTITLKAAGLNTNPNQLDLPEGSLVEATNVVIERENVIQPCRGTKLFGEAFGSAISRCSQMWDYRGRIIRQYGGTLQFQNGVLNSGDVNFDSFNGTFNPAQAGLRTKTIDSAGNLFFTSSGGIKKISAKTGDQFSTNAEYIVDAGAIKAIDFTANLTITAADQTSFLTQDSAVAYRHLWAYKDANDILVPGTPSQREEVYNPLSNLLVRDLNRTLLSLDYVGNAPDTSLLSDVNYVSSLSLPILATGPEILNNCVTLADKIDVDILYANESGVGAPLTIDVTNSKSITTGVYTITFSAGTATDFFSPAQRIYLNGFTPISGTLNGLQTIATVTATTITMNVTVPNSIAEVEKITCVADAAGSLNNRYFLIDKFNALGYYVWFNVNAAGVDPAPAGGRTGVVVAIATSAIANNVATALAAALNGIAGTPYSAVAASGIVTVTHTHAGTITSITDFNLISQGFTFEELTDGQNGVNPTSSFVDSGTFRAITRPSTPDIPTPDNQLVAIQTYLGTMITDLQLLSSTGTPPTLAAASRTAYIVPLDLTMAASVTLDITIPTEITSNYLFQLYRSSIASATGVSVLDDISPNDELQLVYEAYPTAPELSARRMIIPDLTPDEFRGANLYTNASTGEGILQSNDVPPFALDINRFKNVVFYANTRTRHRLTMSLLGVQNMIDLYNASGNPSITIISGANVVNTYTFVTGLSQITQIVCGNGASLAAAGAGDYFNLYSGENETAYYVWYQTGVNTDPAVAGKTGIKVVVDAADTAAIIAQTTVDVLSAYSYDFTPGIVAAGTLSIIAIKKGYTTASTDGNTGFTITQTQAGRGENTATGQILLSTQVSVALAVDETARSMVRVINANSSENLSGYYTSSGNDVPGKFYLEAKDLTDEAFYLISDTTATGLSLNPDISPTFTITNITTGLTPVVTTAAAHGLSNGEAAFIALTNSTPVINGQHVITYINATSFSIAVDPVITVAGTSGVGYDHDNSIESENEAKQNRIYYSKKDQAEAVPLLNYFDVGDSSKTILRIFPLRDSLFIFKEDGLYRLSGEVAPFTVALFDGSVSLAAPDSLALANNVLYGLTTQGITAITEGGTSNEVTNPIEAQLKHVVVIPSYKTACFGIGYESDNSYTVYMPTGVADDYAQIGYRYSTRTKTWTIIERPASCGFVNSTDDKLYFGAADTNYIEQERKNFDRTDYSGREYLSEVVATRVYGAIISFDDISDMQIGDVLVQSQQLTVYEFNMLLRKLDLDTGLPGGYFTAFEAVAGEDLRASLVALAAKLVTDTGNTNFTTRIATKTGTINAIAVNDPTVLTASANHGLQTGRFVTLTGTNSSPTVNGNYLATITSATKFSIDEGVITAGTTGTFVTFDTSFQDITGCFNILIDVLNTDVTVSFSNYRHSTIITDQEIIITGRNNTRKEITGNVALDFIAGPITLFKAVDRQVTWAPNLFGDPVNYKHLREATIMFINKAFTSAELSFATDLLPEFIEIPFTADSNGIFGYQSFGTGFFGGGSNSAPFRTYIPRQCQRCRYIVTRFNHMTARETFGIQGITITGENTQSTRAYRS